MAEERLGASFSIDVSELKAGIAQANRLIRESESEFRAAAAGMDDWTASEDGLNAKIKSLNDITDIQREKVDALKTQYQQLIDEGLDPASREAVELRTKINQEEAALKKNEAEIAKQIEALKKLRDAADDTGDDVEEMADDAEEASDGLSGLKTAGGVAVKAIAAVGAACVGAVTAFLGLAESTKETRVALAKVDQSFETAGLGAENASKTMEELYGVLGDTDRAVEASSFLAKMSKDQADLEANTRILTGVFAEYGDSIPTEGLAEGMAATAAMGSVQGVLADALEWQGVNLDDFNAKLAEMSTEEERAAYIQQSLSDIYGESADSYRENNAAIIEANEAQLDLTNTLAELGAIAEPIMTSLKELAADLLTEMAPFITLIGEGLSGALNGTEGAADSLAEGLSGMISTIIDKVVDMLPFVIDTIIQVVPKLLEALLEQLPTILTTLLDIAVKIIEALSAMLPTIVEAIMKILPQLINSLIAAIPQLIQAAITFLMAIVDAIPVIMRELVAALPSIISTIISTLLSNIPMIISAAIELLFGIIEAIPQIITELPKNMPKIIKGIVDGLIEGIPELVKAGGDMLEGLFGGMIDPKAILDWVKDLGNSIVGGIKEFFGIHSPSTLMADVIGKNLALGIGEGFTDNIGDVNDEITSAMNFEQARNGGAASRAGVGLDGTNAGRAVVVNQNNYYAQAHSRLELYKTKQNTAAAVRLAMGV